MRLTDLTIRNFRCIRDLSLDLDETTVLIGENNTGKTSVLEAVQACLERPRGRGRRQFDEYDYRLAHEGDSPTDAEPIEIQLSFVESATAPWHDEVGRALVDVAPFGPDDLRRVTLRVTSEFDDQAGDFTTDWSFLDAEGEPLAGSARSASQLSTLQGLVPIFYLSALRDASRHFASNGQFWRSFLGELGLPDDVRAQLEAELADLNNRLIDAHAPLAEVRGRLEHAKEVVDFGATEAVTVDALPTKLFALLSRTQVHFAAHTGARIPVTRQGEGTQSLAVLLLFGAFLRSRLSGLDLHAEAITALEEPEAHLHPSATRALMHVVGDLPGQKLISTHSGHLLSSVSARAIRRLAYEGGEVKAYRINWESLAAEERRKFDSHIRRTRGELLFARCWLLVEGETEVIVMTGAAEALGLNLDRVGVYCVEYSQTDASMLAKVANQLGIAWYCVADDDDAGRKYVRSVCRELGSAPEGDRVAISYENMEQLLCESGFGDLYESHLSVQKDPPTANRDTKEFWQQVLKASSFRKPIVATQAVERMMRPDAPTPVPAPIEAILNKAAELAGAS